MILVMTRSSHDHHDDMQESLETQPTADEKAEKAPIEKKFLHDGFQPGRWDVICHNGKDPQSHGEKNASKCSIGYVLASTSSNISTFQICGWSSIIGSWQSEIQGARPRLSSILHKSKLKKP